MSPTRPFMCPEVTDDDITWVTGLMQLPQDAFCGANGDAPRLEVLKSSETLDIEACPGSGKTTLLVAKLAILARKWTDRRRGICVLSHTNVARREIEKRLGSVSEGKRLLAHPHFVGTIHAFVNEFLAIPWLRSKGFPIKVIDDAICQERRWGKLPAVTRDRLKLNRHDESVLKITKPDFSIGDVRWSGGMLGRNTPAYRAMQNTCRATSQEGYFCHDEMFVWANELLDQVPAMRDTLRERFPILFIDEVQDNSELQSSLLFRVFREGDSPVMRQRFGDANQAIYQYASESGGAVTDTFPNREIRKDLPNSYRFGQEIADFARPLALETPTLVGWGPDLSTIASDTAGRHSIFLFDDESVRDVLPTYASYLTDVFSDEELRRGVFTAVGAVHRQDKDTDLPRSVRHYWPNYDHELTALDPAPSTFRQYLQAGLKATEESGEAYHIVDKTASALLHLIRLVNPLVNVEIRRRPHRYVLELLRDKPFGKAAYMELVTAVTLEERPPTIHDWQGRLEGRVRDVVEAITERRLVGADAQAFLVWPSHEDDGTQNRQQARHDNIYRYPLAEPRVLIRVGSIHSVKGETHTATLVLDTFYHEHHLATLKPWLLQERMGAQRQGSRNRSRLKQHYVAMTRPSHLLCLAMRDDAFKPAEIDRLKSLSWRVARVSGEGPVWL